MELDISTADGKLIKWIKKSIREKNPMIRFEPGPEACNGYFQMVQKQLGLVIDAVGLAIRDLGL